MLRLYILRHAKSSWAQAGVKDFDRGLNSRGASDLPKIAATMKERGYLPPQVYCSPALRTRLTMHGIILAYNDPPRIDYVDRLYSGATEAYINCLMMHERAEDVMFVGHNPSVAEFAHMMIRAGDDAPMRALSEKFPTGAMAVIDFEIGAWSELGPNSGYLVDFVRPADL